MCAMNLHKTITSESFLKVMTCISNGISLRQKIWVIISHNKKYHKSSTSIIWHNQRQKQVQTCIYLLFRRQAICVRAASQFAAVQLILLLLLTRSCVTSLSINVGGPFLNNKILDNYLNIFAKSSHMDLNGVVNVDVYLFIFTLSQLNRRSDLDKKNGQNIVKGQQSNKGPSFSKINP